MYFTYVVCPDLCAHSCCVLSFGIFPFFTEKTLSVSVPQKSTVTISDSPSPNSQSKQYCSPVPGTTCYVTFILFWLWIVFPLRWGRPRCHWSDWGQWHWRNQSRTGRTNQRDIRRSWRRWVIRWRRIPPHSKTPHYVNPLNCDCVWFYTVFDLSLTCACQVQSLCKQSREKINSDEEKDLLYMNGERSSV